MKVLVLGGTSFVGRHIVLAARAAGMDVTLFNRGQTNPALFADLERITGDRDGGLDALAGRDWDAVVDVTGYVPRVVDAALDALADRCGHYVFISTISVYDGVGAQGPDEDSTVGVLSEDTEAVTAETYGPLKAACEDRVRERMGDRGVVIRPGLVVGPHDPTERFVRWVRRAADGGEMLAPGDSERRVTFVDGRDLADFAVRLTAARTTGTFNAIGPAEPLAMGDLLKTCVEVAGAGAQLTWLPEQFLLDNGAQPWADLPLWLAEAENGMITADNARGIRAGLTFRTVADTVRATLRWDRDRPKRKPAGMSLDREREILAAWHQTQS